MWCYQHMLGKEVTGACACVCCMCLLSVVCRLLSVSVYVLVSVVCLCIGLSFPWSLWRTALSLFPEKIELGHHHSSSLDPLSASFKQLAPCCCGKAWVTREGEERGGGGDLASGFSLDLYLGLSLGLSFDLSLCLWSLVSNGFSTSLTTNGLSALSLFTLPFLSPFALSLCSLLTLPPSGVGLPARQAMNA